MFLVSEPTAWGLQHVPFNAALLKTIRFAFPNDSICFYAEDSHSEYVREQIGEELAASIVWKGLALPSKHSGFYNRFFSDFKMVKFLLNELNQNTDKDVLVITANSSILWALKHYVRSKHQGKKVQTIIHGNFSTLHRIPRRSMLNPFYYISSLKTALRLSGYERLQHIVLEESVRDVILQSMPLLRNSVFVLDHPIPVDKQCIEINNFTPPIHFGFLGRATEKKGLSKYLDVASEITQRFPGKAKFHFIGWISKKQKRAIHSKLGSLNETVETERMGRNEYVKRLKNLHFACLFYNEYYEYCASGVLLDCIASGKPIIATQLPIFTNIQKRFGDIGYLCRNNEITETVSNIIHTNDSDRYQRQVFNIVQAKGSRTPETLAMKYLEFVNCL